MMEELVVPPEEELSYYSSPRRHAKLVARDSHAYTFGFTVWSLWSLPRVSHGRAIDLEHRGYLTRTYFPLIYPLSVNAMNST